MIGISLVQLAAAAMIAPGLSGNLSQAAGFPVRCEPLTGYGYDNGVGGVALVDKQEIVLSLETCREISQGGMRRVDGLVTLAHERQHLLGVTDEQEADCEAIWDVRWLARRLGYRISRAVVRRYAGAFYASCVR